MIIEQSKLTDIDAIMALENDAFDHGRWSATSWTDEIEQHYVAVARIPQVVGVIAMSEIAGTAQLLRIIVDKRQRQHGIGHLLVGHGVEWASGRGAAEILLEVESTNSPAASLYSSYGFTPIDKRKDYYGPGEDAVVMRKTIEERHV